MILGECPKCRMQMNEFPLGPRLPVEFCSQCKGMWLDHGVLAKSCGSEADFPESSVPTAIGIPTELACVRCGSEKKLEKVLYSPGSAVEIEYCRTCLGMFLDFRELPAVQGILKRAPVRDVTAASVSRTAGAGHPAVSDLARPSLKETFSPKVLQKELSPWFVRIFWNPRFIFFSGIGVIVTLVLLYFESIFLLRALPTRGMVTEIIPVGARCGSVRNKYDCTKFDATVEYRTADEAKHTAHLSAGSVRGRSGSLSEADFQPNVTIPILYDPQDFSKISHDTFAKGWGFILGCLAICGLAMLNIGLAIRRRGL